MNVAILTGFYIFKKVCDNFIIGSIRLNQFQVSKKQNWWRVNHVVDAGTINFPTSEEYINEVVLLYPITTHLSSVGPDLFLVCMCRGLYVLKQLLTPSL